MRYTTTGANYWHPRQPQYDWQRQQAHGKLQPMPRPGFIARLFRDEGSR